MFIPNILQGFGLEIVMIAEIGYLIIRESRHGMFFVFGLAGDIRLLGKFVIESLDMAELFLKSLLFSDPLC